ncbi:MAG: SDR family NAD(P)-dependent oxidoreductase [Bacteroidota bacterium]
MSLPELDGAAVLVTGASRGLGRAVAVAFGQRGARVAGLARSTDDLRETGEAVEAAGGSFLALEADITIGEAVLGAFETLDRELGALDALINNAGLGRFGEVDDLSVDDWHLQVDVNLTGLFRATRLAVPRMLKTEGDGFVKGHIVNIASVAGLVGNPKISAYNATKFGVRGFSEATMKELRPKGIRVTCVYPGSIDTPFFDDAGIDMNPNAMTPESVAASVLHAVESPAGTLVSEIVMRPMQVG